MRRASTKLLPEDRRSIEQRSCKRRDSNERPNYQNVSFSLSSAASFFDWSQMVDVSLLESFPFLTSFYGTAKRKFPKTLTILFAFAHRGDRLPFASRIRKARAGVLRIEGAQCCLDAVTEAGDALFDGRTE